MIICGIELKSNNAIFSVVNIVDDNIDYMNVKPKKIILEDDDKQQSIISFKNNIDNFINDNNIEKMVIKKRATKGTFAGGSITFKMEAIIQLNTYCDISFISSQAINKFIRNNDIPFPHNLHKYQEQSYLAILAQNTI